MRRRDRYIGTGVLLAGGAVAILDILLQRHEHKKKGIAFTWNSYDGMRTIKRSLIGAAVGGGLGYGYYRYKLSEESTFPFNSDNYLRKTLTEEHLKANPQLFGQVLKHRENVKQWLVKKFGSNIIAYPEDAGSFHKRTAIGSNYDLDIIVAFSKKSYYSLNEMYEDVYEKISWGYGDKATVTRQGKAVGIVFENGDNPIYFDIVPGKEINDYKKDKELNLYVNPKGFWQRGTSFKINVDSQKKITVNRPESRRVIKLLRAYRDRNNFNIPTVIIEQCVVDALSEKNYGVYLSDTENLLNSMLFLSRKIEQKSLIDFSNSNNNLNNKVSDREKSQVAIQLENDVKRIEENPRYIKEIFEC